MTPSQEHALRRKRILVTGASGFIGSHLIKKLSRVGANVLALCHSPPPVFLQESPVEYRRVSLLNFAQLRQIITKFRPEKIVHLAGLVNLERSYGVAKSCIQINITGTLNLLEVLKEIQFQLFVYVSTEEVYGSGKVPYREEQKESPPSPYAITKLAGEQFCQLYLKTHQYPVCILRLSSCYGPGQEVTRFIPSVILSCLRSMPIHMNSGQQRRDFLYIEDAIDGIVRALASSSVLNQVINLGGASSYRFIDIVGKIKELMKSNLPIVLGSVPNRAQESACWQSDSTKARRLLGWREKYSFPAGLSRTIAWYRRNYEQSKN